MPKPHIAVASLGGTITMTRGTSSRGGIEPTLGAAAVVASAPALTALAQLDTATLSTSPGASLGLPDLMRALEWARARIAEGAAGVVILQGTDTIEESAYFLDLFWAEEAPLVVTGAMQPPHSPGYDGADNLQQAVIVAASSASRNAGVLVAMNGKVHMAARVVKSRASGPQAFTSPNFGPVAYVDEGHVAFGSVPRRLAPLQRPRSPFQWPLVTTVEAALGDDGSILSRLAKANISGLIVAGFGVGHLSKGMSIEATRIARKGIPVVLTTRAGAGTTFTNTYGFEGSETTLLASGLIPGGWLHPRKARLLLTALLASETSTQVIRGEFVARGRPHTSG